MNSSLWKCCLIEFLCEKWCKSAEKTQRLMNIPHLNFTFLKQKISYGWKYPDFFSFTRPFFSFTYIITMVVWIVWFSRRRSSTTANSQSGCDAFWWGLLFASLMYVCEELINKLNYTPKRIDAHIHNGNDCLINISQKEMILWFWRWCRRWFYLFVSFMAAPFYSRCSSKTVLFIRVCHEFAKEFLHFVLWCLLLALQIHL